MAAVARVVIVEDEAGVRNLVRRRLEVDARFDVVGVAADASSAVAVVGKARPDIVVLDLRVPGAIGTALVSQILAASPATEVAVFSGLPPEVVRAEALSQGAARYVLKGDVETLIEALDSLVAGTSTARDFTGELASVRQARRFAADALVRWSLEDLVDPVTLIVSELTTNAVVHARSDFSLRLALARRTLRVEVVDCGAGLPNPIEPDPTGIGGRGLLLVAQLSAAWGVDAEALPCKTVWCEVALPQRL